jgi:hypothetical protein
METEEVLRERIDQAILNGETLREFFNLQNPSDLLIFERLAYFRYAVPLMVNKGVTRLCRNDMNDCLIDCYLHLKQEGRLIFPLQLP